MIGRQKRKWRNREKCGILSYHDTPADLWAGRKEVDQGWI